MTTKLPLQKILQGILHTESESKQNHDKNPYTLLVAMQTSTTTLDKNLEAF
jgi:hypothetical protein